MQRTPPEAEPTASRESRPRRPWSPRRRIVAFALAGLLLIIGVVAVAETVRVIGDAQERAGIAAFSEQPEGAADGEPGTLVKAEELSGVPFGTRAWRIMYRSTDLHDQPIVVTGVVVVPLEETPAGGRTVLAWGHPTTGSAPDCAPSWGSDPFIGIEGMRMMLDRGYAVVATDYAGMGTAGPDSYLVGETAARTVLDAVRAARHLPETQASARTILWGHSQGGQAVLFAAEQAPDYAPELEILAVAAAAPAADLTALMGSHLDDISGVTIGSYAFAAFAEIYGPSTPGASLESILTPAAIAALPEMNALCLLPHLDELHRIGQPLVGDFTVEDPTTTEPWASLLAQNSAGSRAFDAPLFIAQGADDELVLPADTEEFVAKERALGIDVTYRSVPFATHGTIAYLALPELELWLDRHVPGQ